ncbi:MAG: class I SAM-dependent methyltransferase [Planctomycetota bacterium]
MTFTAVARDAALLFADPERLSREIPFLKDWIDDAESLLDVGCGSGDHLAAVADRVAHAEGIDPEAGMVALARERHPGLSVGQAGAETPPAGPWQRIMLLGNVFGCLPDPAVALRLLAKELSPDGSLLIQVPDRAAEVPPTRAVARHAADGDTIVAKLLHHCGDHYLLDLISHHRRLDGFWEHDVQHQRLHAFDAEQLRLVAAGAGLRERALYGNLRGGPPGSGTDLVLIAEVA